VGSGQGGRGTAHDDPRHSVAALCHGAGGRQPANGRHSGAGAQGGCTAASAVAPFGAVGVARRRAGRGGAGARSGGGGRWAKGRRPEEAAAVSRGEAG